MPLSEAMAALLSPSKGLGLRNVSGEAVRVSTPVRALLSPVKGGGRTPGRGRTPVKVRTHLYQQGAYQQGALLNQAD